MVLNPFFQQGARSEQNLVQDLINEQLRMYGVEVHYLPRKYVEEKTVIREVVQSRFDDAYPLEAYVDTYDGYGDNPVILSKFGIEAKNEVTLTISKERWENYIEPLIKNEADIKLSTRPKEGDLIYFPLGDRLFEIKYVEHEKPFYQLQKTYIYELRCELFRYEDEVIDTGIEEIDDELTGDSSTGISEDGTPLIVGPTQTLTLVGTGVQATAQTTVLNGVIRNIQITNRGGGYIYSPTVGVSSAPTDGVTGIATCVMIGGIQVCDKNVNSRARSVQQVLLTNPGMGYTVAPLVQFSGGEGAGAAATSFITTQGGVGIVTVNAGNAGYTTTPTVTFATPIHVGAAATALLDTPMVGGGVSITAAVVSTGASAYLFPGGTTGGRYYKPGAIPSVTFALPTGGGNIATATATLDTYSLTGGTVASVAINTGGRFYTSAPAVTFSYPPNVGAAGTVGIAGSVVDANQVALSTTGRAYRVAPTVSVAAPHVDYNGTQAVGIATIHPITGIVTAVGFNSTTDAWAVGTAATVGLGYTVSQLTLSFSGSTAQERATGTTTIDGDGQVISVSIGNSGYGYVTAPTVTIDGPGGAQEDFRALGVATMRYNSITEIVTVGAASTEITGVTTNAILVGDRVRQTYGWDSEELNVRFIGTDAYVSHIGMGVIYMSEASTNVGVATTSIEFGIPNCGIVTGIAVTFGGGGYLTPPEVSIANTIGNSNYHEEVAGITTATGVAILNEAGTVISIGISESGFGYIIGTGSTEPIITVGAPSTSSIGNYLFNEQVSGSISGAEARVRSWNATTNILEISSVSGTFIHGDTILGQTSGASHALRVVDLEPTDDGFADNLNIEIAADEILDFTEQNPFGTP